MRAHTPHDASGTAGGTSRPPAGMNGHGRAHSRTNSASGIATRLPSTLRDSRMGLSRSTSTQPPRNPASGEAASGARPRPGPGTQRQQQPSTQQQHQSSHPSRHSSPRSAVPDTQSFGAASSYRADSQESSKENMAPPDAEEYELQRRHIEELKAEVGTLLYKLSTFEQEREMARLQHEAELRDARRKAEDDFKQRQAAEATRAAAERQVAALQAEAEGLRGDQDARQRDLERKLRDALDEACQLQEQVDDLGAAKEDIARTAERRAADLQAQLAAAQRSLQERQREKEAHEAALQQAQQQVAEQSARAGQLEADVLRLKAQTGDAATMEIIRRELKDQVSHIRALEATNREQLTELRHLRQTHKAIEIVEEEKRSLLRKLESAQRVEQELDEERLQRQRLETEHRAWAAFLEPQNTDGDGSAPEFDSPEAVARALMEARFQTAELTERLGALGPELAQRDASIRLLEAEKKALATELERAKATAAAGLLSSGDISTALLSTSTNGTEAKIRARLERQRALAVKEIEYLRAQLKAVDTEDMTFNPEHFDQQKADRVQQLEGLVDQYRAEAESLQAQLTSAEASAASAHQPLPATPVAGSKRPHADGDDTAGNDDAQVGQLVRKARKLQDELAAAHMAQRVLETELAVAKEQLAAEKKAAGVRILALRSNPTSDLAAAKQATLAALTTENAELLAHIQRHAADHKENTDGPVFTTVPLSVLAAAQRQIAAAQAEAASAHKTSRRLKEVWAAKSAEFKEAVESTLGWHVTFIPNGKMRVESVYWPSATDENERSIVFDGERGTMKVGGGPRSAFAQRIDDQIRFWVREKGCIPGFLAALTLEFCEEQARTTTVTTGR